MSAIAQDACLQSSLDETVRQARKTPLLTSPVTLAAIHSSGFEAHRASNYFVRRRSAAGKHAGKWQAITYRRFPKLGVVCDCSSHFILAAVPHRGPSPDFGHWAKAMEQARSRVRIKTLLADAGYDAEWIHAAARIVFDTRTLIPPSTAGRPTSCPAKTSGAAWPGSSPMNPNASRIVSGHRSKRCSASSSDDSMRP